MVATAASAAGAASARALLSVAVTFSAAVHASVPAYSAASGARTSGGSTSVWAAVDVVGIRVASAGAGSDTAGTAATVVARAGACGVPDVGARALGGSPLRAATTPGDNRGGVPLPEVGEPPLLPDMVRPPAPARPGLWRPWAGLKLLDPRSVGGEADTWRRAAGAPRPGGDQGGAETMCRPGGEKGRRDGDGTAVAPPACRPVLVVGGDSDMARRWAGSGGEARRVDAAVVATAGLRVAGTGGEQAEVVAVATAEAAAGGARRCALDSDTPGCST